MASNGRCVYTIDVKYFQRPLKCFIDLSQITENSFAQSVFFCNSGAEANEAAIKASYRYHHGKRKTILHSNNSFHGKLIATGSISSPLKNSKFPNVLKKLEFKVNDFKEFKKI